jgi:hypothetical protein
MATRSLRAAAWLACAAIAACGGDSSGADAVTDATDAVAEIAADVTPDGTPDAAAEVTPVTEHPNCTGFSYTGTYLMPGPCEAAFDAGLDAKARRYERVWRAFNAGGMGVNTDVTVALAHTADREAIAKWLAEDEGWDFEAFAGKSPRDVITTQHKTAGLYAGVGVAADAFRYGVLRDQGYPEAEVAKAREFMLAGIEGFHIAATVPGKPGVIARGTMLRTLPGASVPETLPLFDAEGHPLPEVKNNGAWRDDFSGKYPDYIWEDSISRDQMLGWVTAAASVWEVIRDDASVSADVKAQLRADSLAIARELMVVRESGYDLEIPDADGRTTLHGWLNENNLDGKAYIPDLGNGFHASMALGFVAAWVYVTEDPELTRWLHEDLIGKRRLHELVRDSLLLVWAGKNSNYSNYNMAFGALWLAQRYLDDPEVLAVLRTATRESLYAIPGQPSQPEVLGQSYFDFIYAAGDAGQNPWGPLGSAVDEAAVTRGTQTLRDYPEPPYWDFPVVLCPDAVCDCDTPEVASSECTAPDGTELTVLGCVGRNCDLITAEPIPMKIRPPSNYHWRSNPFKPSAGGDGSTLLPGVDFRIAYWTARWTKRAR